MAWHAVIVDEAHKLKNENSKTYKACESIATKLRYGLTGTVMQVSDFTHLHGHEQTKQHLAVWLLGPACHGPALSAFL